MLIIHVFSKSSLYRVAKESWGTTPLYVVKCRCDPCAVNLAFFSLSLFSVAINVLYKYSATCLDPIASSSHEDTLRMWRLLTWRCGCLSKFTFSDAIFGHGNSFQGQSRARISFHSVWGILRIFGVLECLWQPTIKNCSINWLRMVILASCEFCRMVSSSGYFFLIYCTWYCWKQTWYVSYDN